MARSCFVVSKGVRKEVMGGEHWIEIKERLTYYEAEKLENAVVVTDISFDSNTKTKMDMDLTGLAMLRMQTFLIDWSFTADGEKVPVSREAIEELDPVLAKEVEEIIKTQKELIDAETNEGLADTAIEKHKKAIAELETLKNGEGAS